MQHYLAIDIGGTSLKYGIVLEDGTLLSNQSMRTPASWETFLEQLDRVVEDATSHVSIQGIAFSAPGAVDSKNGTIHGVSAVMYIHERPFKQLLHERYALPITVLNDANAAALAEGWTGAATDLTRYATVVIGTGIGGAFVESSDVMIGSHFHGGEYGYWILDHSAPHPYGTWSAIGATSALVKACSKLMGRQLSGEEIFTLQSDPNIQQELERFYHWNAVGLYNVQFAFDPERILIGGGISRRPEVQAGIKRHLDELCSVLGTLNVDIQTCAHFNEANLIGAVKFHLTD